MKISELRYIKGIGEKRAEAYTRLGITSPDALLHYYPKGYISPGKTTTVKDAVSGEICSLRVIIDKSGASARKTYGRQIYKLSGYDETGSVTVTYFNNPYTPEKLIHGEEYILFGRLNKSLYGAEMINPVPYPKDTGTELIPVYRQSALLSGRTIEKNIETLLSVYDIADPIPEKILEDNGLIGLADALHTIHAPKSEADAELAKERLVFDELFYFQLGLLKLKRAGKGKTDKIIGGISEEFYRSLPFKPTNAQRKAVAEALSDMSSGKLMNRLLQGDVGSGKTLVAAALCYAAYKSGYQSVMMAPTEILANQHYTTMRGFLEKFGVNIVLLTGSMTAKQKSEAKEKIRTGEGNLIIGTHALIENDVEFSSAALVITDEQHRFGVAQRGALLSKGEGIHHLVMSATPIPRTLALVMYSDLDVSVLDELPSGRQPIDTMLIDSSVRERALGFIKKHCDAGRNVYIVCPLIEEGEESDLISVEEYYKMLENSPVKDVPRAVLHGKMKQKDKDEIMRKFISGEIKLLISTTVIEVGVDVPNANIMMIENAERFGLSALHQLRGRIGRGSEKSYCILVSDAKGKTARERLGAICKTSDGFKIAEYDLKTRGPGDFFGNMQHGLPEFKIADTYGDMRIVKKATDAAVALIKDDPDLLKPENGEIRAEINRLFSSKTEAVYL